MKRTAFFLSALTLLGACLVAAPAHAKLQSKLVEYKQGDVVLEGYLVYDDAFTGKRPGILVVHEWMGLNDYAKKRADMLAALGYVAFAPDIYGKGVRPGTPKDAGAEAGKYKGNRPLLRARALAGLDVLQSQPQVDKDRLAAIGYCFGGTTALEVARSGAAVKGVVSFHGGLDSPTPADAKNIKARVLVLHGAADPYVPAAELAGFLKEMEEGRVDYRLFMYGGAVHGFTNWGGGSDAKSGYAYDKNADERSWAAMRGFFDELFGPMPAPAKAKAKGK